MAFRIQDLMVDVLPGGYQMVNPRCSCQISAEIQREPALPGEEPENVPNQELDCQETLLPPSADCPADEELLARAANLVALRSELRRALHAT